MTTKTPHVHAEVIKAWAEGATIQYSDNGQWFDTKGNQPQWSINRNYRVKPERKSDVVMYGQAMLNPYIKFEGFSTIKSTQQYGMIGPDNLMLVFDGETGKLKDAQVLAHE